MGGLGYLIQVWSELWQSLTVQGLMVRATDACRHAIPSVRAVRERLGRFAWPSYRDGAHTHAPALSLHIASYLILRYNQSMHIISRKALRQFWEKHPDSQTALARWFKIMLQTEFRNFSELRATFPTADKVGDWIVFNIGGNKYRLIASIHFNRGKVYIRHVLTHPEYEKGAWKL